MTNSEIFILTDNEIKTKIPKDYSPIICGNEYIQSRNEYIKDNEGKSISTLYPFYKELTGQYWAWKNSEKQNIGFCLGNVFFLKNYLTKLKIKHVDKLLGEFDIILPEKTEINTSVFKLAVKKSKRNTIHHTRYPVPKEWTKMRYAIEELYPEYLYAYELLLEDKSFYEHNIFITNREILNDYMIFVFRICEMMRTAIDKSDYIADEYPLGKYFAEILLNTYIRKNQLKIKEVPILEIDGDSSIITSLTKKNPSIRKFKGSE